jgi:hypothetical protein
MRLYVVSRYNRSFIFILGVFDSLAFAKQCVQDFAEDAAAVDQGVWQQPMSNQPWWVLDTGDMVYMIEEHELNAYEDIEQRSIYRAFGRQHPYPPE